MSAPVLTDLAGRNFTEGDYVVYSTTNGIRYGRVEQIKNLSHPDTAIYGGRQRFKVYVNLDFHRSLTTEPGKMYAKKMGYDYDEAHFLKVSELTDT